MLYDLPEQGSPREHAVHFYGRDERQLAANVCEYLTVGLRRDETLLLIATPEHAGAVRQKLDAQGTDPHKLEREGRLLFIDARDAVRQLLDGDQPDWGRFEAVVGTAVRDAGSRAGSSVLRGYGEIVGLMWSAGQHSAAVRVEQFWNRLMASAPFPLLCGYPIDVFEQDFQIDVLEGILSAHGGLLPSGGDGDLNFATDRALYDILGPQAEGVRREIRHEVRASWGAAVPAETTILWLRQNLPGAVREIIDRAREHYSVLRALPPLPGHPVRGHSGATGNTPRRAVN